MIINWLLYSLLVGVILGVAGVAFEYGARALRLPTRWVWLAVMALSTAFSALSLAKRSVQHSLAERAATVTLGYALPLARRAIDSDSVPTRVWSERMAASLQARTRAQQSERQPVLETVLSSTGGIPAAIGVDERSFQSYDRPLLIACASLSVLGLLLLAVTFVRLNGVAYALDHAVVEGVPVLLSRNIGPALLGVTRFRVVLPRWVTKMSSADVRTILAHEQEHALAKDPTLTLVALLLAAVQSWNPAQWFALSRLRLAIESDCDARVLGDDGDARRYGRLLVKVYQRTQAGLSPLTSFVTRTSQLESRIHRIVDAAPKSFSFKTVAAIAAALLLCSLAYSLEVTAQRGFGAREEPSARDSVASAAKQQRSKFKYQRDTVRSRPMGDTAASLVKFQNDTVRSHPRAETTGDTAASLANNRYYRDLREAVSSPLHFSDSTMLRAARNVGADSTAQTRPRFQRGTYAPLSESRRYYVPKKMALDSSRAAIGAPDSSRSRR